VHLLNLASVRDIAAKVKKEIPNFSCRRFRSNILLTGPSAYDEDDWKRIRIGNEGFHCACHTVRCQLPNVDPHSSERHPREPDKTLKAFRCIDDGDPNNACLGLMLVPAKEKGVKLQVGQGVEVLERGEASLYQNVTELEKEEVQAVCSGCYCAKPISGDARRAISHGLRLWPPASDNVPKRKRKRKRKRKLPPKRKENTDPAPSSFKADIPPN
jgi:hypothetical protein